MEELTEVKTIRAQLLQTRLVGSFAVLGRAIDRVLPVCHADSKL